MESNDRRCRQMIDRRHLLLTSLSAIALAGCRAPLQTDAPDSEFFLRENSPPGEIVPKLMVDDDYISHKELWLLFGGKFPAAAARIICCGFYHEYPWHLQVSMARSDLRWYAAEIDRGRQVRLLSVSGPTDIGELLDAYAMFGEKVLDRYDVIPHERRDIVFGATADA
jgi:hypothetical protein